MAVRIASNSHCSKNILPRVPADGGQQKFHCRPGRLPIMPPGPKMNQDGHSRRRQPAQHGQVEKAKGK